MARQTNVFFRGTINNMTGYIMHGTGFLRAKSKLSTKRVQTSPEFAKTREYARKLGEASSLASTLYKTVPPEHKSMRLFRLITGLVITGFKKGNTEAEVKAEVLREIPGLIRQVRKSL